MSISYNSGQHRMANATRWEPERDAEQVSGDIWMSRGNSNSYLVSSSDGDVLVNVGWSGEAPRHRERYERALGRPLDVRAMVFTQSHIDHCGGRAEFDGLGVEIVAQANIDTVLAERDLLRGFWGPRAHRLHGHRYGVEDPWRKRMKDEARGPVKTTTLFADTYSFTVGGRTFELFAVPNGETLDSLVVWLPEDRAVFTGNLTGALWGALPNLYTLRGDRIRSAAGWLHDVDRVLALQPEYLITGHGDPLVGADLIQQELGRIRDGVAAMFRYTIDGMNAGRSLEELMDGYEPPADLPEAEARGKGMWFVRAIWEENVGWFRFASTTELYPVPRSAVFPDLVELTGGADALAQRAQEHVDEGRPLEAIHLTDVVLGVDPSHCAARAAQISALEVLLERSGGLSYDEVCWLETEIGIARAALE
jgi:glyoxylase-like metal-dependent hydrolase (beta-lactamase superfamily II)